MMSFKGKKAENQITPTRQKMSNEVIESKFNHQKQQFGTMKNVLENPLNHDKKNGSGQSSIKPAQPQTEQAAVNSGAV